MTDDPLDKLPPRPPVRAPMPAQQFPRAIPLDPVVTNTSRTADSSRRAAEAAAETAIGVNALIKAGIEAQERELKMLFWTRVAGIAAIAALAVSLIAIAVTLAVS